MNPTEVHIEGNQYNQRIMNLCSKANDFQRNKQFLKAKIQYIRCLDFIHLSKGNESSQYAIVLNNLGNVQKNQGHDQQALSNYKKSLYIKQTIEGKDTILCLSTCINIGRVYQKNKNYSEAQKYFRKAVYIANEEFGLENIHSLTILKDISKNLYQQGKFSEALPYFEHYFLICILNQLDAWSDIPFIRKYISNVISVQKGSSNSIIYMQNYDIKSRNQENFNIQMVYLFKRLCICLIYQEIYEFEGAQKCYEKLLADLKQKLGVYHQNIKIVQFLKSRAQKQKQKITREQYKGNINMQRKQTYGCEQGQILQNQKDSRQMTCQKTQ